MPWMLKKMTEKEFGTIKLYCTEMIAIFTQSSENNRRLLASSGGIEIFLKQVSVFRKRNPIDADENEFLENLFDVICSCLLLSDAKEVFLREEGMELMKLMMK